MAYTSEIEKLEARFNDNPKGRNFAPLADAYRKAGLIDNAIALCQNGLLLHPDYVSAHIVYARCLVDKKDDPAAQGVFKRVLELDGENIIALRALADLAERNGRSEEEVEWLSRLLNADPMNGDAAEALTRAKGKVAAKPAAAAPPQPRGKPDFAIEHEERESSLTDLSSKPRRSLGAPIVENAEDAISFNPGAHAAAKADGLEFQEEVELNAQDIEQVEVEGLARTQYEGSGMFRLDATPPARDSGQSAPDLDESLPQVDLPLIMPDEPPARSSAQPPPPPKPPPPPPPAPRVPAAVALSDDDGAADTATLSRAEPVLTETMAELYLRQGHQQDALRVYQALLAQRPNDARLRSKVEQMSPGGKKRSGVSARGFLKGILAGRGAPAEPPSEPQSTLAAAFDVAGSVSGGSPGEPSHPAHDSISLDAVFGEEVARRSPAAQREARSGDAPRGPGTSAPTDSAKTGSPGFSFDEFFAGGKQAAGQGGTPAAGPADTGSAKIPGRPSGRSQRPPEDEADADQFQQWLKKLKS
ncbi:MAG TPA: tetratricopeptide repeat protein [Gemmatimonadales bacterium]|nr:tetratricopeptide repeat protein [Gemmatimonadales bacterium]